MKYIYIRNGSSSEKINKVKVKSIINEAYTSTITPQNLETIIANIIAEQRKLKTIDRENSLGVKEAIKEEDSKDVSK